MPSARHPLRTLFELLDPRGRGYFAIAAFVQVVDRLVLTAAAVTVSTRGWNSAPWAAVALGGVMLVRSATRALLGVHVRAQVVQALAEARLASGGGLARGSNDDAELALLDGMYAAEEILRQRLPDLLGDVPACLLLSMVLVVREPPAAVVPWFVAVGSAGVAVALVRRVAAKHMDRAWQTFLPALDELLITIHAPLEILGNGAEGSLHARLAAKLEAWKARARGAGTVAFLAGRAPVAAAALTAGLVFLEGGWRPASLTWAVLFASVVPPFAGVARGSLDLARDVVRAKPVLSLLGSSDRHLALGTQNVTLPADVTFAGLSFAYAGASTPTLSDIDAVWRPGTLLGLAGQNGSGKSTFARILLGLERPSQGTVSIGGQRLADLELRGLRRQIGYLTQRPYLPDRMSVGDAVRMLAPRAADDAICASLARLGLYGVLERRRPEAPLDVKISTLSTGERQRVAVSRVLLRDAPMVLLDEPDANLDVETVAILAELLVLEARTRMVLVIAHSPALLARMDRVLYFDEGRIRTS